MKKTCTVFSLFFGALLTASCAFEPMPGEGSDIAEGDDAMEEVSSMSEALTVSGWTPYTSGSCGTTGCSTIVTPRCANGSIATGFSRRAHPTAVRLRCEPRATATSFVTTKADSCPAGTVVTGVRCVLSQWTQYCNPELECSSVSNATVKADNPQPIVVSAPTGAGCPTRGAIGQIVPGPVQMDNVYCREVQPWIILP